MRERMAILIQDSKSRHLLSLFMSGFLYVLLLFALVFYTKTQDFTSKAQHVQHQVMKISLMAPPLQKKVLTEQPKPVQKVASTQPPIAKKTLAKKTVPLPKEKPMVAQIEETLTQNVQQIQNIEKEQPKQDILTQNEPMKNHALAQPVQPIQQQPVQEQTQRLQEQRIAKEQAFYSQLRALINQNKTYPNTARRRGIQGDIEMKFLVHADGNVADIERIEGAPIFEASAKEAIEKSFPMKIEEDLFSYPKEFKIKLIYVLK